MDLDELLNHLLDKIKEIAFEYSDEPMIQIYRKEDNPQLHIYFYKDRPGIKITIEEV